ncbi:MAG: hypothetical protein J1E83_13150 [Lachnospiraceae bacterium]|nr:hypothetical protein [Lachnospiraceae bacterium]
MGRSVKSVSVIGGADGPTSVFVAGKSNNLSVLGRIKRTWRKKKRLNIEKKIVAVSHTLDEVVRYMKQQYHAGEIPSGERRYQEQRRCFKESLIMQYRPELLGETANIKHPKEYDEASLKELWKQIELRSKKAEEIGNDVFPIDYHLYEISYFDKGKVAVEIENTWGKLGVSYSGNKKAVRQLRRITKDIMRFYGVTQDDINNKTERFHSLVSTLCE